MPSSSSDPLTLFLEYCEFIERLWSMWKISAIKFLDYNKEIYRLKEQYA